MVYNGPREICSTQISIFHSESQRAPIGSGSLNIIRVIVVNECSIIKTQ